MTGLTEYLCSIKGKNMIIVGVSSDYCMDATIKSAYKYFNEFIWPKRYAETIRMEEAIERIRANSILFNNCVLYK